MQSFSQRLGITPVRESLQVGRMDKDLEVNLWNVIVDDLLFKLEDNIYSDDVSDQGLVCRLIWKKFFKKQSNKYYDFGSFFNFFHEWYFKSEWYEKYDCIEFLLLIDKKISNSDLIDDLNQALKEDLAGYRIISRKIVQITAEEEIMEIEEALSVTSKFKTVGTHLSTALSHLSDKTQPDFRNSMKESISAVESMASLIAEKPKATLGEALGIMKKEVNLHPALKNAFSSLYGYTSDAGGVRHKLMERDDTVSFEDAKFLLITCSAFINYLKVKIAIK